MAQVNIPTDNVTWGTAANGINSNFDEIYGRTGWASYIDTQYATEATAFTASANTDTVLPNNAGTVIQSQKPTDVTSFYDGSVITGRQGDGLGVLIYFKAQSSSADQWLDIWIDIGSPVGELYRDTKTFPKGSGSERGIVYALPAAYTLDTWQSNGGTVYIRSNANVDVYDINFNFMRLHKGR